MIEISPDLYRIEIPLPQNPLKALNAYVIKGPERSLVIDTGWNQGECRNALLSGLNQLGIDIRETDFFITHLHTDHLGLVSSVASDTSVIYFNQPDADRIQSGILLDDLIQSARVNGFPARELKTVSRAHPVFKYRSKDGLDFAILKEGDLLRVSDYVFRCVETPGHTKGHMCLYEPRRKILVAGDHILAEITPSITLWSGDWNPLNEYLKSLDKIDALDVDLVLPGHRDIFRNPRERIQGLKRHHQERLKEITAILKNGRRNAFQVASRMTWDILHDSWELFPVMQKWFATGEALSHLKYLEEEGLIRREIRRQKILYSLNNGTHGDSG